MNSQSNPISYKNVSWLKPSRIIFVLNIAVFIIISIYGGKFPEITPESLVLFGAKESSLIALGQWWRLVTPIFIHNDLMHLLFNSWAIFVFGPMMETTLGNRRFLFIYGISGIAGVVASCLSNVNISVGASGAIFGLLGTGFFMERRIKHINKLSGIESSPQDSIFTSLIIANIVIGILVPNIDNAAHFGGLFAGFFAALGFFYYRQEGLSLKSLSIFTLLIGSISIGGYWAQNITFVAQKFVSRSLEFSEEKPRIREYFLSKAVELNPDDYKIRSIRLEYSAIIQNWYMVSEDLQILEKESAGKTKIEEIKRNLENKGFLDQLKTFNEIQAEIKRRTNRI